MPKREATVNMLNLPTVEALIAAHNRLAELLRAREATGNTHVRITDVRTALGISNDGAVEAGDWDADDAWHVRLADRD